VGEETRNDELDQLNCGKWWKRSQSRIDEKLRKVE
jgi:hypothetical protein